MAPQPNVMNAQQANLAARGLIAGRAIKRTQQIFSQTIDTASQVTVNIPPRNVGLILGFIVRVSRNVAVGACGTPLTINPWGPANLVQQFRFDDLNNNTRLQTTGWHMHAINSARGQVPYLACRTNTNYPIDYGNKYPSLMEGGATISAGANDDVSCTWFVPLAYSEQDLRGAIYANVINATMNLQLQLANAAQVAGARTAPNTVNNVYSTANSSTPPSDVTVGDATVEVYQVYYDQLPQSDKGVILPMFDLATVYELKNTALSGIVANQDFPIAYSNFRDFLSTTVIYQNRASVAGGAGWATEADINNIALESANYTNIWEVAPRYAAAWGRQTVGDDFPLGAFYLPSRQKPVSTVQFGNMSIIVNAADVQSGAAVLVGFEAFALTNQIGNAQGLAAG